MLMPNASSGNVSIPLANGNILKVPVENFCQDNEDDDHKESDHLISDQSAINISEQLNNTCLWQSIDQKVNKAPVTAPPPQITVKPVR
ncbi:SLC4A7 [Cordylochernes scorpioides]|uniref:SLC4A7 n=1 Tax=Cordylochernes scorpioides TaxID=51811 RepID=A0ABY6KHN3_9ARAC|nr:SLC4A7 [Cordylochernes scorpioides]